MLKAKLLILWFKKIIVIVPLLLLSSSCSMNYLYDAKTISYTNLVYIKPIPEKIGMIATSYLRAYFKNNNIATAKYILKINLSLTETLQLNNIYGFATQGELWVTVNWSLIDKFTNKPYITSSVYHPAYYSIVHSAYATNNNKKSALNLALKNLSMDLSLKVSAILKQTNGNLSNNK